MIGFSDYHDEEHIADIFNNGNDGYLLKNTNSIEIELAIIIVISGKHYFSKDIPASTINNALKKSISIARINSKA